MKTEPNDSALPLNTTQAKAKHGHGFTKREKIALEIMKVFLNPAGNTKWTIGGKDVDNLDRYAELSVSGADALITALNADK